MSIERDKLGQPITPPGRFVCADGQWRLYYYGPTLPHEAGEFFAEKTASRINLNVASLKAAKVALRELVENDYD
jgi:hypothetical protein